MPRSRRIYAALAPDSIQCGRPAGNAAVYASAPRVVDGQVPVYQPAVQVGEP